jgi:hypothetical protein
VNTLGLGMSELHLGKIDDFDVSVVIPLIQLSGVFSSALDITSAISLEELYSFDVISVTNLRYRCPVDVKIGIDGTSRTVTSTVSKI